MTNQQSSSVSVTVVTQPENPSFLSTGADFKKLSKELSKLSKAALETLEILLNSADEKMRFQAAKTILELDVSVKDKINTDNLQRLIAEVKFNRAPQSKLIPVDGEEPPQKQRPTVNFHEVRQID